MRLIVLADRLVPPAGDIPPVARDGDACFLRLKRGAQPEKRKVKFTNKTYPDFTQPDARASMLGALMILKESYLGRDWPHLFLGREIFAPADCKYTTRNPNQPAMIIGSFQKFDAGTMDIDALLAGANAASRRWNDMGIGIRAKVVEKTADLMEDRIMLIGAALVAEVGKSYTEAYACVAEAIDFLRYNAELAREEYDAKLIKSPETCGNMNCRVLVPHGVFLGLDPFNFQVAIGTDQIAKPLLMGNAVIASPSDKASLCGRLLFQTFLDAFAMCGVDSAGIINWAPGSADIARPILAHPGLAGLCFTGSAEVLDTIIQDYGMIPRWHGGKLVVAAAETSGVDALYVHEDADLDVASTAIAAALCGLSGQKCSALTTIIAHEKIQDKLLEMSAAKIDRLTFGSVWDGAYLGAVISAEAKNRIFGQVDMLMAAAGVAKAYEKAIPADFPGFAVAPTILRATADQTADPAKLAILRCTEIFGPVCTLIPVASLEQAEQVFNASNFALTGGICSRNPQVIEHAIRYFRAGNLYINRKITGAFVGSEPFGGLVSRSSLFGISAGSRHALTLFYSDKTVSGFMPS